MLVLSLDILYLVAHKLNWLSFPKLVLLNKATLKFFCTGYNLPLWFKVSKTRKLTPDDTEMAKIVGDHDKFIFQRYIQHLWQMKYEYLPLLIESPHFELIKEVSLLNIIIAAGIKPKDKINPCNYITQVEDDRSGEL